MQARKNGFEEEQKDSVNQKCDGRIGREKERQSDGKAYKSQKERQSKEEIELERKVREE
jgi:hypothetical protein